MNRLTRLSAAILTSGIVFFAAFAYAEDKIVAIVNNEVITQKDMNDALNFARMQMQSQLKGKSLESKIQSIKLDLLNKLIEDRLILREAKLVQIRIDDSRVQARLGELKKRYPSGVDFQRSLAQQGLTEEDVKSKIREQLFMYNIIEYKIRSKIIVSPSEVTEFYEKNKAQFQTSEERELEVIITDKPDVADAACRELKSGADFKDTVNKFSLETDKLVANKGEGGLSKDIEEAVFGLSLQEISKPVQIEQTYYIFKLTKINPPRAQTLLEVQDDVYAYLFDKKMQEALNKWLDELKKQSYIKILQS